MSLRKTAFTLAETLLTLAIVGVIAAMTIPGLREYSEEAKFTTSAKKAYTSAQAVVTTLETRFGDLRWWPWSSPQVMSDRFKSVMHTLPNLVESTYKISYLDGTSWTNVSEPGWFQTTDGMTWSSAEYKNGMGSVGAIYVDTNGPAMPNRVGVDVLGFVVSDEGIFPMNDKIHDKNAEWGCVYYIFKNGKLPWLNDSSYSNCKDTRIDSI